MRDPYEILQLSRNAEIEVIEAAYRRLARKYHPDTNPSIDANLKMQEINWAYEVLSDPLKRRTIDRIHDAGQPRTPYSPGRASATRPEPTRASPSESAGQSASSHPSWQRTVDPPVRSGPVQRSHSIGRGLWGFLGFGSALTLTGIALFGIASFYGIEAAICGFFLFPVAFFSYPFIYWYYTGVFPLGYFVLWAFSLFAISRFNRDQE